MPVYADKPIVLKEEVLNEDAVYTFNGKYVDSSGRTRTEKGEGNDSIKINIMKEKKKEEGDKELPHDNRLKLVKDGKYGPSIEFFMDDDYTYSQLLDKDVFKNDNKPGKDNKEIEYYKYFTLAASIYARDEIKEFMKDKTKSAQDINDKITELFEKTRSYKSGKALRMAANDAWKERNPNKELPKSDKEDYK